MDKVSKEKNLNNGRARSLAFVREVVKYFMDFLETDFHKRRNPKRTVRFRSDNNLLIGIDLSKYTKFKKLVCGAINQGFHRSAISKVGRGIYRANIPGDLLQLVKIQSQRLTEQQINGVLDAIAIGITKATSDNKDYDRALSATLEFTQTTIKGELVHPFITYLDKPLKNLALGDENTIYMMEDELASIFSKAIEDKIANIVRLLITGEKPDARSELALFFNLEEVKNDVNEFFESYQVKDLYAELYEIYRNKNILDKQDAYLYFYDITFQNTKYPIFYIPFDVEKETDGLKIEFDSQVYINKKALEYIVQQYNEISNKKGSLKTTGERIIYLSQYSPGLSTLVTSIINEITDFFELDSAINTSDTNNQIARSSLVKVSNSCYINLSEKSDEALVNDYEEILQLLLQEDSILGDAFNGLIDDFIHEEPTSFNSEVEDAWEDNEIGDKLVFETPVPLNSEQRQILEAVRKEGCKYITVEGPPGTGKSHTITAIACDAILNDKSVLVLSDKKEALDVVEDKITQTMDQVRYDKHFQNPILRLGKTGNTYSQILSAGSIENIKIHQRALKNEYETLVENINKSASTLKEYLEAEVLAYAGIEVSEISELVELESYYSRNECFIDLEEASRISNSAIAIEDFRELMRKLRTVFAGDSKKHRSDELLEVLGISLASFKNLDGFRNYLDVLAKIIDCSQQLLSQYKREATLLAHFDGFSDFYLGKLEHFVMQYDKCCVFW